MKPALAPVEMIPVDLAALKNCKTLADVEALYPPRDLPAGAEVVRVAPSPTGLPHLGTAMQCVIDRTLADKTGGRFILRIEDTDQNRLVDGAIDAIIEGIGWLGTEPDEGPHIGGDYGPYIQSHRLPIYRLGADYLLEKGHAYRCFCTAERLDLMRKTQMSQGLLPRYDGLCRKLSAETIAKKLAEGVPHTVRMKIPEKRTIQFHDVVRGPIAFESDTQDDAVLLKSDGFPTYHLAVILDDHFMRVTTVVRGEEWISSAPKHVLLYEYFGWTPPKFLHTVLLRDAQKRKLSKRSGDTSIRWFQLQGYLPEGFRNFLTRVMWAHPQEKDIYSFDEFKQLMAPEQLPATGPVADFALLGFINGKYITDLGPDKFYDTLTAYFQALIGAGQDFTLDIFNGEQREQKTYRLSEIKDFHAAFTADPGYTKRVLALEPERIRRLGDVLDQYAFAFAPLYTPPAPDALTRFIPDAVKAKQILADFAAGLKDGETHEEWEARLKALVAATGEKPKNVFMLIRVAMTGVEKSPPLYETAVLLGAQEIRSRLTRVSEALK